MTELLEKALATTRDLPPEIQDEIARVMLTLAGDDERVYRFTPEEAADQDAADAEEVRGEYASDASLCAIWAKYGL